LVCLILPKAASVLRLKSYLLKKIVKATSTVQKGFPKTANSQMNGFLHIAANGVSKSLKYCLPQQLSETQSSF
jgi:hypothetical protein